MNDDQFTPQNLSEVEGNSLYIDNEGKHDVVIVKCENTTSQAGTQGWRFNYRDAQGRMISDTCWLTEAAKPRLKSLGIAAGLNESELQNFIPPMIYGRTIQITTKKDPENPNYQKVAGFAASKASIDKNALPPLATKDDLPF